MRNRHDAPCYVCGRTVKAGGGYFERQSGRWWTRHARCASHLSTNPDYLAAKANAQARMKAARTPTPEGAPDEQ